MKPTRIANNINKDLNNISLLMRVYKYVQRLMKIDKNKKLLPTNYSDTQCFAIKKRLRKLSWTYLNPVLRNIVYYLNGYLTNLSYGKSEWLTYVRTKKGRPWQRTCNESNKTLSSNINTTIILSSTPFPKLNSNYSTMALKSVKVNKLAQ